MTPKEKAKEFIDSFYLAGVRSDCYVSEIMAKNCALKVVNAIISSWNEDLYIGCDQSKYWQEVKNEIQLL